MKFVRGFWETPEPYLCFHTTPCLRKIMNTGGLYSRAYREDNFQTLGGEHDISISAYADIQDAKNTLMFLYRVWQRYHGYLTDDMLLNKYTVKQTTRDVSSHELMWYLTNEMGAKDPIVKGDDWAKEAQASDFGIIAFYNPARKAFIGWLEERGIRFLERANRRKLGGIISRSSRESYLRGARGIETNFYSLMRGCMNRKTFVFDPFFSKESMFNIFDQSEWINLVFGRSDIDKNNKTDRIEIGNVTLDFSSQFAALEDIYEYEYLENEIRIFCPVFVYQFLFIYDIQTILNEAKDMNGGREPLFWKQNKKAQIVVESDIRG